MYRADHSFRIGDQHLRSGMPCQDYALSGVTPDRAYAVVSDGCSSGGKTEIGAAITCVVTANILATRLLTPLTFPTPWNIYDGICRARDTLSLNNCDLLATCCLISVDDRYINIRITGDGAVAWQEDDSLNMTLVSWANNRPLYPIYQDDNYKGFIESHGPDASAPMMIQIASLHATKQTVYSNAEINRPLAAQHYNETFNRSEHPDITKVAIFTDGICQVQGMDWRDVIKELMAFKSLEGDFVKRRLNRFMKDHHIIDDLGYACIQIGGEDGQ